MPPIIRDVDEAIIAALDGERVIGIDIETSGLSPYYDEIMVIQLYGENTGECAVLHVKADIPEKLKEFLRKDRVWIFHNGVGFDVLFFKRDAVDYPYFYDTLVAEQVLATTSRKDVRKNLGAVMKRRIGANFKGEIDHSSWQAAELTETQVEYAANDVRYLPRLYRKQLELCSERGLTEALKFETGLMPKVVEMQNNGLEVNVDVLKTTLIEVARNAEDSIRRLGSINPNSAQQVKAALARKGIEVADTQVGTLQEIIMAEGEAAQWCSDILVARRARKRTGMYDDEFISKFIIDGRVHGRFWQTGTGTVRFSSSDPNLQQIPRDLRKVIGNNPGFKVVAGDYEQVEIRILAGKAEDDELIDAVESEDFHSAMASIAFDRVVTKADKEVRQHGKAVTFTWTFLGGAEAVVANSTKYGQKLLIEDAEAALSRYRKRFYKTTAYQGKVKRIARGRKSAVNIYLPAGHRRTLVGRSISPSVIINTEVQGTAGVGMKHGIYEMAKDGLMGYVGATVHDELVATGVPNNEAEEYGEAMSRAMIRGMQKVTDVPIKCDIDVADMWL